MDFNHKPYAKHTFKNLFGASGGQLKQDGKKEHFSGLFSSKVMSARTTGLAASAVGKACYPAEKSAAERESLKYAFDLHPNLGVTPVLWVQEGAWVVWKKATVATVKRSSREICIYPVKRQRVRPLKGWSFDHHLGTFRTPRLHQAKGVAWSSMWVTGTIRLPRKQMLELLMNCPQGSVNNKVLLKHVWKQKMRATVEKKKERKEAIKNGSSPDLVAHTLIPA